MADSRQPDRSGSIDGDTDGGIDVVVIGSLNVDLVTRVEHYARPGETVLGSSIKRLAGGKGANQALGAIRAGARTRLIGCVGTDAEGAALVHGLALRCVDVSRVRRSDTTPTGTAIVAVDGTGESTIVVAAGANGEVSVADIDLDGAAVVLLQLEIPVSVVSAAVRRAGVAGIRVVLNCSPYADLPDDVLATADPVIANEHERERLGTRPPSLVTTLGAKGARWERASGEVIEVSAPEVDRVVDATGAGDAFAGALAASLAAGKSERAALEAAVAAGSESVTAHGAQGWALG
jgi:ribokinase